MNPELRTAAEEILEGSGQTPEYKRRLMKLLENITTANFTDADVRQVVALTTVDEED